MCDGWRTLWPLNSFGPLHNLTYAGQAECHVEHQCMHDLTIVWTAKQGVYPGRVLLLAQLVNLFLPSCRYYMLDPETQYSQVRDPHDVLESFPDPFDWSCVSGNRLPCLVIDPIALIDHYIYIEIQFD